MAALFYDDTAIYEVTNLMQGVYQEYLTWMICLYKTFYLNIYQKPIFISIFSNMVAK